MGVSDGDAGDPVLTAADGGGAVDDLGLRQRAGDLFRLQRRLAHVDSRHGDPGICGVDRHGADPRLGLNVDHVLPGNAPVVDVFRHGTDARARDDALAAVPVEQAHPHVRPGDGGLLNERDAVSAHAAVTVAEADAQGFGAGDGAVPIVDDDVVGAGGHHLGEGELRALVPHLLYVHQLRVVLRVAAGDKVRQRPRRVE